MRESQPSLKGFCDLGLKLESCWVIHRQDDVDRFLPLWAILQQMKLMSEMQSLREKLAAGDLTLKALGFFLPVQHWGVFSTPLCKTRSRHPRKMKFTGLKAYVIFYKICKFESLTIINDVIMTSLQKTMAKFGILH